MVDFNSEEQDRIDLKEMQGCSNHFSSMLSYDPLLRKHETQYSKQEQDKKVIYERLVRDFDKNS